MRHCGGCNQEKTEVEFNWKNKAKRIRQRHCKECQSRSTRAHYAANPDPYRQRAKLSNKLQRPQRRQAKRVALYEYLTCHPCVDCGESDPVVLEFDHRDPKEKLMCVAAGVFTYKVTMAQLLSEIKKCDVRCANCHKRRTAAQFNWFKRLGSW